MPNVNHDVRFFTRAIESRVVENSIRAQTNILRAVPDKEVQRPHNQQREQGYYLTRCAPAIVTDDRLQPWEQQDRSDTNAGKGDAHCEPSAAREPVR